MVHPDRVRIQHMLDSCRESMFFVQDKVRSDLDGDRKLLLAVIKSIEILGEAAGKVSVETQAKFPELPWREIISMRNRLIHGYFDINLDIVWRTAVDELPPLEKTLKMVLADKIKWQED